MDVLPTDSSVEVARSTFGQRPPGLFFAVMLDERRDPFVREHGVIGLGKYGRHC